MVYRLHYCKVGRRVALGTLLACRNALKALSFEAWLLLVFWFPICPLRILANEGSLKGFTPVELTVVVEEELSHVEKAGLDVAGCGTDPLIHLVKALVLVLVVVVELLIQAAKGLTACIWSGLEYCRRAKKVSNSNNFIIK